MALKGLVTCKLGLLDSAIRDSLLIKGLSSFQGRGGLVCLLIKGVILISGQGRSGLSQCDPETNKLTETTLHELRGFVAGRHGNPTLGAQFAETLQYLTRFT